MDIQQIEIAAEAYSKKLKGNDLARLTVFRALWAIMARSSAQAAYGVRTPDVEELTSDLAEGQPFMANHPIEVDAESLADIVELMVACLADSGVYEPTLIRDIKAINLRQLIIVSDMDLASVDPEQYLNSLVEAMQTYGVNSSQVTLIIGLISLGLRSLQSPAAAAMVASLPEGALASARPNACPVCGGRPTLSVMARQKNGLGTGRHLACIQCGTEWTYTRIKCPHCGCEDVTKLGYRTLKDDPAHRIDYCENCGNYIRTVVVERIDTPYSIDVEDCVMAPLDAYADEQAEKQQNPR